MQVIAVGTVVVLVIAIGVAVTFFTAGTGTVPYTASVKVFLTSIRSRYGGSRCGCHVNEQAENFNNLCYCKGLYLRPLLRIRYNICFKPCLPVP